jgi:hypothetical protein
MRRIAFLKLRLSRRVNWFCTFRVICGSMLSYLFYFIKIIDLTTNITNLHESVPWPGMGG